MTKNEDFESLRNKEGDLATVVDQPSGLEYLNGMVVRCELYRDEMWYVIELSENQESYLFHDFELVPLGNQDLVQEDPNPFLLNESKYV